MNSIEKLKIQLEQFRVDRLIEEYNFIQDMLGDLLIQGGDRDIEKATERYRRLYNRSANATEQDIINQIRELEQKQE